MRNEGDKKLALEPLGHDERFRVQILAGGNLQRAARHLLRGRHLHVAQSVDLQVDAQYVRLFHRLAQQSRAPVGMRNSGVCCRTAEPSAGCPATEDSPCRSPASRRTSAGTRRASGCPQRPVKKTHRLIRM